MYRFLLGLAFLFVVACSTKKDAFRLSEEEYNRFSTNKNEVLYDDVPVGKFQVMEYEYYDGKMTTEYSLLQYERYPFEMSEKILRYMHMRFPDAKIEVKFQRDSSREGNDD